jgi:hypothetical protein
MAAHRALRAGVGVEDSRVVARERAGARDSATHGARADDEDGGHGRNYMDPPNTRAAFPQRIRSFAASESGRARKSSRLRLREDTPGLG